MIDNKDLEISVLKGDKLFNENTPFIININTPKLKNFQKISNADLICVIDISGSMSGRKIDLVKNSLIILIKMMDENDRLALVLFSDDAKILCDLEYMTESKKNEFISKVKEIGTEGGTNILIGLKEAVEIIKRIKNEKNKKRGASILLLSDGCDNYSGSCLNLLNGFKKFYKDEKLDFILNTFGYGNDHDPDLMNRLANLRDGSFFYVQDYKKVSEYFVTVLGGCVSVISKNVKVAIKILNEHCRIVKVFGAKDLYYHELENHIFKTEILQLLCDKEYTYVLEMTFDEKKVKKNDEIIYVELLYKDMNSNNKLIKNKFIYKNDSTEADKEKANEEYIRCQVYYVLDEALKLREKNKNKEANDLLSNMEDWIKKNYKGNNNFYLEDIQKSINLFKEEYTFNHEGKAFAKSNIKQKIHKKIGGNDMYKNSNMDYYCKNIDEKDYDYCDNNNYYNNFDEPDIIENDNNIDLNLYDSQEKYNKNIDEINLDYNNNQENIDNYNNDCDIDYNGDYNNNISNNNEISNSK